MHKILIITIQLLKILLVSVPSILSPFLPAHIGDFIQVSSMASMALLSQSQCPWIGAFFILLWLFWRTSKILECAQILKVSACRYARFSTLIFRIDEEECSNFRVSYTTWSVAQWSTVSLCRTGDNFAMSCRQLDKLETHKY